MQRLSLQFKHLERDTKRAERLGEKIRACVEIVSGYEDKWHVETSEVSMVCVIDGQGGWLVKLWLVVRVNGLDDIDPLMGLVESAYGVPCDIRVGDC